MKKFSGRRPKKDRRGSRPGRARSSAPAPGTLENEPRSPLVRLNKLLAANGIASRRHADQLIRAGRVTIDGAIVSELGTKVDPAVHRVEIDGVILSSAGERHRYYLLNKPSGVVCTTDAREARPRAVDLITDKKKGRIYTVGRLDEESVGLVILTNDGDFANLVTHPRYGVPKTYRAEVSGHVQDEHLERMIEGVRLSDGKARFSKVKLLHSAEKRSLLLVTLREGMNREVRRVLAALGFPTIRLRRVSIGRVNERGLKVGHWRVLERREVEELSALATEFEGRKTAFPARRARAGARDAIPPRIVEGDADDELVIPEKGARRGRRPRH